MERPVMQSYQVQHLIICHTHAVTTKPIDIQCVCKMDVGNAALRFSFHEKLKLRREIIQSKFQSVTEKVKQQEWEYSSMLLEDPALAYKLEA